MKMKDEKLPDETKETDKDFGPKEHFSAETATAAKGKKYFKWVALAAAMVFCFGGGILCTLLLTDRQQADAKRYLISQSKSISQSQNIVQSKSAAQSQNINQSKDVLQEAATQAGSLSDKAYISREAAVNIAYDLAGINAGDAARTKAEFDVDDGIAVYEVEFYVGTIKYEVDINAQNGQAVKYEKEDKGMANPANQPPDAYKPSENYIGAKAAETAAISHKGITASQVTMMKTELDYENGTAVYEVEFKYGRYEYEYEIDAVTGAVLRYHIDY